MSKPDYVIIPKKTVISNPAVNYGAQPPGLKLWVGDCTSFERRVRFGKEMPVPWVKEYTVRADSEEMATQLIGKLAYRDGYALGGVRNVRLKDE